MEHLLFTFKYTLKDNDFFVNLLLTTLYCIDCAD